MTRCIAAIGKKKLRCVRNADPGSDYCWQRKKSASVKNYVPSGTPKKKMSPQKRPSPPRVKSPKTPTIIFPSLRRLPSPKTPELNLPVGTPSLRRTPSPTMGKEAVPPCVYDALKDYQLYFKRNLSQGASGSLVLTACKKKKCDMVLKIGNPTQYKEAEISMVAGKMGIGPKIYEYGQCSELGTDVTFILMEKVEGQTLAKISYPQCASAVEKALSAYLRLIERGIFQRDLKGENIIVTPEGDVRIIDYGIAIMMTTPPPNDDINKHMNSIINLLVSSLTNDRNNMTGHGNYFRKLTNIKDQADMMIGLYETCRKWGEANIKDFEPLFKISYNIHDFATEDDNEFMRVYSYFHQYW